MSIKGEPEIIVRGKDTRGGFNDPLCQTVFPNHGKRNHGQGIVIKRGLAENVAINLRILGNFITD